MGENVNLDLEFELFLLLENADSLALLLANLLQLGDIFELLLN